MKKSGILLCILVLLIIPTVFAQEESALCTPELEEGRSCEDPSQIVGEELSSERFWETYSSLPTKGLKRNYLAEFYILPKFNNFTLATLILSLIISALILWRQKPKSWSKKFARWKIYWKPILATWVILFILLGLFYSWAQYYKEGAEQGIVVCKSPTECKIAMHIHADLEVFVCGEKKAFPAEEGDLSKAHTHKERNKLHWHDTTPFDPDAKELLDPFELTVGAFFEQAGETFTGDCLFDRCNEDICPGSDTPGSVSFLVDGVSNDELDKFVWADGEEIMISFE